MPPTVDEDDSSTRIVTRYVDVVPVRTNSETNTRNIADTYRRLITQEAPNTTRNSLILRRGKLMSRNEMGKREYSAK